MSEHAAHEAVAHAAMGHGSRGDDSHGMHAGGRRHEGHTVEDFRRRFWVCVTLTAPVVLISPGLPFTHGGRILDVPGADWMLLVLASAVYAYGGAPFLRGLAREVQDRVPGMMTLVAVAITVAYAYSSATVLGLQGMPFFWELATLVDVMLLGHWIEMRSIDRASGALESLAKLMPSQAHLRNPDGTIVDVALEHLEPGEVVVVRPGEKVPADGDVIDGRTTVDESLLTGESAPVARSPGDRVIGGSVNGEGAIAVTVTHTGAESFLAQVVALVREAQESKSRTQGLADRAALWLTIVALGGGALTFAVWLALGEPVAYAIERAVTVMVVACPHALGLAVPLVVANSTTLGAKNGILIRDRAAFEDARLIDTVLLDKTGTLTLGHFGVDEVVTFGEASRDEVLALAGSLEELSEHPIARAVAEATSERLKVEDFAAMPGTGVRGRIEGSDIEVVSPGRLAEAGIALKGDARRLLSGGRTVVFILRDGSPIGAISLSDLARPESAEAVRRMKEMGIEPVMLTGDNAAVAGRVARELGITRYFAQLLPADKATTLESMRAKGSVVAMVGDGVNDAPSLAAADVGIAIGAGTEVAVATADVVLVRNDPRDVPAVIALARATYTKMVQNLAWATGYNLVAIPLAAGVLAGAGILLSPAVGGLLMSASTVIVALNARTLSMKT